MEDIDLALTWGREHHTRGAKIYAIGRKEVEEAAAHGVDLRQLEGLQVVTCDNRIVTTYRNQDFKGLRPSRKPRRRRRRR